METNELHREELLSLFLGEHLKIDKTKSLVGKGIVEQEHFEVIIWLTEEIVLPAIRKALIEGKLENF